MRSCQWMEKWSARGDGGRTKILDGDGALLAQAGVLDKNPWRVGDYGAITTLSDAQTVDGGAGGGGNALVELGGRVGQGNGGVGGQLLDGLAWGIGSAASRREGHVEEYRAAARRE